MVKIKGWHKTKKYKNEWINYKKTIKVNVIFLENGYVATSFDYKKSIHLLGKTHLNYKDAYNDAIKYMQKKTK